MLTLPLLVAVIAAVLALLALTVVIVTARKQNQLIERQQQRLMMLTETAGEVLALKQQLAETASPTAEPSRQPSTVTQQQFEHASAQLQRQVEQLHQEQQALEQKFRQLSEQDPGARLYQRAAKLVADGASVEDIMQACELPRAEAELICAMRK